MGFGAPTTSAEWARYSRRIAANVARRSSLVAQSLDLALQLHIRRNRQLNILLRLSSLRAHPLPNGPTEFADQQPGCE